MADGIAGLLGGLGGGILGSMAGGAGTPSAQNGYTTHNLAPLSALGQQAQGSVSQNLTGYQNLVNAGPGQQQVTNANASNQQYANMLQQYTQSGGMPTSAQYAQAQQMGQMAYGGQFALQQQNANQLAAQLGRPVNDPIIQAKLAASQANTMGQYVNNQSQQLAQNQLNYGGQLASFQGGLASQAMSNRQAILGMGNQILGGQQQMQVQGQTTGTQMLGNQGGGMGGSIVGGLAGMGNGASSSGGLGSMFSSIGGLFSGGGSAASLFGGATGMGAAGALGGASAAAGSGDAAAAFGMLALA